MSLNFLANKWRAFKEAVKRLWNDYLEYYSQNGWFMILFQKTFLFINTCSKKKRIENG